MIALAILADAPHGGHPHPRTRPELSDAALFIVAVIAVWLVRRALGRRFPKD